VAREFHSSNPARPVSPNLCMPRGQQPRISASKQPTGGKQMKLNAVDFTGAGVRRRGHSVMRLGKSGRQRRDRGAGKPLRRGLSTRRMSTRSLKCYVPDQKPVRVRCRAAAPNMWARTPTARTGRTSSRPSRDPLKFEVSDLRRRRGGPDRLQPQLSST